MIYTVREPGMSEWWKGEGKKEALRQLKAAKNAGLHRAMILNENAQYVCEEHHGEKITTLDGVFFEECTCGATRTKTPNHRSWGPWKERA